METAANRGNIQIRDLRKGFPQPDGTNITVLNGISLEFKSGEFISLIGPVRAIRGKFQQSTMA
jgi:ABC-type multidrug transport system ATPase subunit